MTDFTPTQGRYLSFIQAYINLHGCPPAESEIATAMCVSPPSVNQMVKMLEKKGLVLRQPGVPRSMRLLVPEDEIPSWRGRGRTTGQSKTPQQKPRATPVPQSPPANLYVLSTFVMSGPISETFTARVIRRDIEIRGDQTLDQLHHAIFEALERQNQHLYQFQFGKRSFDPDGPNYGNGQSKGELDASTTVIDDLQLKSGRAFGYWFDPDDNWYHQIQVERVEEAIPTVTYPRVIRRVGKSPPQYMDTQPPAEAKKQSRPKRQSRRKRSA